MDDNASAISRGYAPKSYALSGKIMLSAIVVLFTVVVIIVCVHIYARWFIVRAHRRRIRRRAHLVFYSDTANPAHNMPSRGLDAALLRSLPVFVYSSKSHEEVPECAVCLSEFEENEKGRLLPKCNHSFHIDCIDMWFHSHSTCPICRGPVMPEIPTPVSETSLEIVVSDGEQAVGTEEGAGSSGLCASCENNTQDRVGSSSSSASIPEGSSSLGPRRNQVELVGVSIEVPRRNECYRWGTEEEMRLGSPGVQGLKSPGSGSRIRSLKRILSRDRRMGAVSPRSASAQNCSSATDPDLERGREEGEAVQARTPR